MSTPSHDAESTEGDIAAPSGARLSGLTEGLSHKNEKGSLILFSTSKSTDELAELKRSIENTSKYPVSYDEGTDRRKNGHFDLTTYSAPIREENCEIGSVVLYGERIRSTQDLVGSLLPVIPNGFLCVADTQTNGKGRGENVWESPPGCLLFTFVSRFAIANASRLPFVQYLVSLAIVEAVKRVRGCEDLDLTLKWPNDIYAGKSQKIGGVLCQSSVFRGHFEVVVGVGLNVDNDSPTTCINGLLRDAKSDVRLSRADVLGRFCATYESMQKDFLRNGFDPFFDAYYASWLHRDQVVRADVGDGGMQTMTVKGLAKSGALLAVDVGGNSHELFPDGNRFDFFRGLVSRRTRR